MVTSTNDHKSRKEITDLMALSTLESLQASETMLETAPKVSAFSQLASGAAQYTAAQGQRTYSYLSQQEKINRWLRQYGFSYNPFEFTDSERDPNLEDHFVQHEDFDKTRSLNDRLIFAGPGQGKSAIRLRLQADYRESVLDQRIFAFSYLIPQALAANPPTTITDHLPAILTAAVQHAFLFFALRGVDLPNVRDEQSVATFAPRFARYFDEYYGTMDWREDISYAIAQGSLRDIISNLAAVYDDPAALDLADEINERWLQQWFSRLTSVDQATLPALPEQPLARWHDFWALLASTGIRACLILVDGVDVKPESRQFGAYRSGRTSRQESEKSLARMLAIVKPLLMARQEKVLGDKVVWKMFLPHEIYRPLTQWLQDPELVDIIVWDYARLKQLLALRLGAATNGAITTLSQLTEKDVADTLEKNLIAQAGASPRRLLKSIGQLLATHVNSTPDYVLPGKLSQKSIANVSELSLDT